MRSFFFLSLLCAIDGTAQPAPDLTKQPALYVVGYAHLDTQWRWEYPRTIGEFLPRTLHENSALFEKYPHYIFNFSGANRYRMMKEYYPADYEKLRQYVKAGRWFPAGSSMEESDVNSPSAESIIRQILYGANYFRHEFGRTSAEYMLPDCFGFPASLPSILAHMGLKGFSTQKLTWGSSAPVGGDATTAPAMSAARRGIETADFAVAFDARTVGKAGRVDRHQTRESTARHLGHRRTDVPRHQTGGREAAAAIQR